jgi:DNA mismatch repair protein MutL
MVGRQPVAFLFIELPPDRVDVNVHPTKVEVRFRDSQQLFRQLLSMIRSKFLSLDIQSQLRLPTAVGAATGGALTGFAAPPPVNKQRELASEFGDWATSRIGGTTSVPPFRPFPTELPRIGAVPTTREPEQSPQSTTGSHVDAAIAPVQETTENPVDLDADHPVTAATAEFPTSAETPAAAPQPATSNWPDARAIQIHDCYLVVETPDGMTVIDQHALHERIVYEHLRNRVLAGAVESQRLLVPQPIELTSTEAATLLEQSETLDRAGLGLEDFGNGTVLVTRYPAMLKKLDLNELLRELLTKLDGGAAGVQTSARRDILDELLHMMSCKAAVKAGQRLSQDEIESLLQQRHLVDDAHHCPHGRPTALSLSRMELDRQFGRLG